MVIVGTLVVVIGWVVAGVLSIVLVGLLLIPVMLILTLLLVVAVVALPIAQVVYGCYAAAEALNDRDAVLLERAEASLQAGEATRALTLLQSVQDLDDSGRGQYIRARALRTLGRIDAARQAASRAVELDPGSEVYRRFRDEFEASP